MGKDTAYTSKEKNIINKILKFKTYMNQRQEIKVHKINTTKL